ncbi:hypothetical protein NE237_007296 [Protea cynaroides]|uniref:Uncharacterized protein n=1 Tax=Protea cynaroides TaxID=273540 RepID=A0A9Q0KNZ1_9MAGN|nr:hypothetical protein NE237_007296 [Protea cynaroides]
MKDKVTLEARLKEVERSTPGKIEEAITRYRGFHELYKLICHSVEFDGLRQSLGDVVSKQIACDLHNFVQQKVPDFNFSDYGFDFDAPTSLDTDDEEDMPPADVGTTA